MEMNGQLHTPAALPPEKQWSAPTVYESEGTPESVWTLWRRVKYICCIQNRIVVVYLLAVAN
jgi:hypothetical protein